MENRFKLLPVKNPRLWLYVNPISLYCKIFNGTRQLERKKFLKNIGPIEKQLCMI